MLTTATMLLMPATPVRITNYDDYRYYRKQLDYAMRDTRLAEEAVNDLRSQPWYCRLLSVFGLLSALNHLARCRLRSVALHDLLVAYNQQSGLDRMLPQLPTEWRLQSMAL